MRPRPLLQVLLLVLRVKTWFADKGFYVGDLVVLLL